MEYQKMEYQRHLLEKKLSALKLIWKMILIVGAIITLTIGTLYKDSMAAWIVLLFLWGGIAALISFVFHRINVVRLHLQAESSPPEIVQVVYPTYVVEPGYPQVSSYKDSNI
jgi:hypothetical protein